MKRILVLLGSERKGHSYHVVKEIEEVMKKMIEVEFDYLPLHELNLEYCKGCITCFDRGEWLCPLKDDRDLLIDKIEGADGVIVATPNYAFQVSARVKNVLDRLAYIFHRPQFFGKKLLPVVVYGVYGGNKIAKYLRSSGNNMGFDALKGIAVNTLSPMTEKATVKMKKQARIGAERMIKALSEPGFQKPSLDRLAMFHMSREGIKYAKVQLRDYDYFKEVGWFESDYYYPVSLNIFEKVICKLSDMIGKKFGESM